MTETVGTTYLIGAGPGASGLITLRGVELLRRADVVFYDYLVNPEILQHAAPHAELVCLGKHGGGRVMTQDDVNRRIVGAAKQGLAVARLKGGDPVVFGRLSEETAALEEAGLPYEIVPGVTAATAASSCTGIPLTHREHASCVAFVTGQEGANKSTAEMNWAALASFPGTLVFYMGVTTAPRWSRDLIDHGKPADTPVAIVRSCSWPQQETILSTLGELIVLLAPGQLRPPATIIVGDVVGARSTVNWFAARPLYGKTVLTTRPEHQSESFNARLGELGADVLQQPAIEISPPDDWADVDQALHILAEFDVIVFSSVNGVASFFRRLDDLNFDARALGAAKLAAIGPATADELRRHGLRADFLPAQYRAEALAQMLAADASQRRFLLVRASRGREILAESLTAAGGQVRQIVAYESRDVTQTDTAICNRMRAAEIDWTTVTSSAIARSLMHLFGDELHKTQLAAISPLTASVLSEAGYSVAAVAEKYTTDGLVDAIVQAESADL